MRRFRPVIFWLHLAAGLIAGAVIGIMSFTGALLAFESEIVAWAERDVRRVAPQPPASAALPLDELLSRARTAATPPDTGKPPRITGVTVSADPLDAVAINFGRDAGVYYANQYTGDIRAPATTRTHDFLHLMEDWHRRLARTGDQRAIGKAITGACNLAFLFLALSGLWLWWPRAWNRRILRPSLWFVRSTSERARDWNWHNVIGFWSLPILVVLTISGAVIGYPWAGDLVYRLAGETPPTRSAPAVTYPIERPADATKLTYAAVLAQLQNQFPGYQQITLREGLPQRRTTASADAPRGPQPYSATVRGGADGPAFASTQMVLDPFTGRVLDRTGYTDQSPGRQARSWLRYLHTGEALGRPGQLLAALASLGGCMLVYTGFALTWRRFFHRRHSTPPTEA